MVPGGTNVVKEGRMDARHRILEAAFAAFTRHGYAAASTAEIASAARVSKRELYALVGKKREMLVAAIRERAQRLELPANLPVPHDRASLEQVLTTFGAQLIRETSDPVVVGAFRLAIAEAVRAPEVAEVLDSVGRATARAALRKLMAGARTAGLLEGSPGKLADQFRGLLLGDMMIGLLLGVAEPPGPRASSARARAAVEAFLQLQS
jgi:AcrR family transcriptional regulator